MLIVLFELLCFVMFAHSLILCIIPEPDMPYTPRERPNFNQKLWEPTREVHEKEQPATARWMKPAIPIKPAAPKPVDPVIAV